MDIKPVTRNPPGAFFQQLTHGHWQGTSDPWMDVWKASRHGKGTNRALIWSISRSWQDTGGDAVLHLWDKLAETQLFVLAVPWLLPGPPCPSQASSCLPGYGVAPGDLLFIHVHAPEFSRYFSQALPLSWAAQQPCGEGDSQVVPDTVQMVLRTGSTRPITVHKPAKPNPFFLRQIWEAVLEPPLLLSGEEKLWGLGEGERLMTGGLRHPLGMGTVLLLWEEALQHLHAPNQGRSL